MNDKQKLRTLEHVKFLLTTINYEAKKGSNADHDTIKKFSDSAIDEITNLHWEMRETMIRNKIKRVPVPADTEPETEAGIGIDTGEYFTR